MEIIKDGDILEIRGVIKSINDVDEIKRRIEEENSQTITLKIVNSFMIPSSLIGFLMKQKEENAKIVTLIIQDDTLYEMLIDLGLDEEFIIKRG